MTLPHRVIADRILHQVDPGGGGWSPAEVVAIAQAHATLAAAEEARTANILALAQWVTAPDADLPPVAIRALLAIARRRLGLFTPAPDEDPEPNGGT